LPSKTVFQIHAGDRLHVWTTGSGGYGSPLERDPEAVLADVLDGRVSIEAAVRDYGVALDGDRIAVEATVSRRRAMTSEAATGR